MRLKASGVCYRYGTKDVVSEVDLEAKDGEIIGILGPNGSGKTTLLKCLNRSLSPRTGTVLIDERDYRADLPGDRCSHGSGASKRNVNFPFTALDIVLRDARPR